MPARPKTGSRIDPLTPSKIVLSKPKFACSRFAFLPGKVSTRSNQILEDNSENVNCDLSKQLSAREFVREQSIEECPRNHKCSDNPSTTGNPSSMNSQNFVDCVRPDNDVEGSELALSTMTDKLLSMACTVFQGVEDLKASKGKQFRIFQNT
jgi:hypothetical protein